MSTPPRRRRSSIPRAPRVSKSETERFLRKNRLRRILRWTPSPRSYLMAAAALSCLTSIVILRFLANDPYDAGRASMCLELTRNLPSRYDQRACEVEHGGVWLPVVITLQVGGSP